MEAIHKVSQTALETAKKCRSAVLVRCPSYHPAEIRRALRAGLDHLDSPERLIRPGDMVLLKPNMLSAKSPESCVTTHPEVITAVGELVLDCRGKIVLGDSPAGMVKNLRRHWEKTGIWEAAQRLGIQPVSFEDCGIRSFTSPEGHIGIARTALETDVIINLPKLKTHQLTKQTGAVKNMFGTVPGFRKGDMHSRAPNALRFARFVVAVYQQVTPALTIMDAVTAMEGNGPSAGPPRQVNALLVAEDGLVLDYWAAKLINMDAAELPIFKAAVEAGLWDAQAPAPLWRGEDPQSLQVADFKPPDSSRIEKLPPFVVENLRKLIWVRPRVEPKLCSACGLCVDNCPEGAMKFHNGVPQIDYQRCIKCNCCDEICPELAIYQQMSFLARLLA
ncbi:MAG: DUF362 domain-containing protein [bacterium]